ncbi:MAG: radical SAM protein [Candidatus Njordarchaeales archaeon]
MNNQEKTIVVATQSRKIIHPIDRSWEVFRYCPHRLVANLYLGCEFACTYCFARAIYPEYHRIIMARINAPERIDKELARLKRARNLQPVDLGSATDPYQPIEKNLEITRKTLKIFLKHKAPVFIVTKSDLVLRDLDLLKELREKKLVCVHVSFISLNRRITALFEGKTPPPEKRLEAIEELVENGIRVIGRIQPVIPYVNDDMEELEELLEALATVGTSHIIYGTLKLSETVLDNMVYALDRIGCLDEFLKLYILSGELDAAGYLIPPRDYRYKLAKYCAEKARRLGMTFGTCKEGFFELHTYRCSGLDLKGRYLPTIEHIIKYATNREIIRKKDIVNLLKRLGADKRYIKKFLKGLEEGMLGITINHDQRLHTSEILKPVKE